jgi:hypothetical protein
LTVTAGNKKRSVAGAALLPGIDVDLAFLTNRLNNFHVSTLNGIDERLIVRHVLHGAVITVGNLETVHLRVTSLVLSQCAVSCMLLYVTARSLLIDLIMMERDEPSRFFFTHPWNFISQVRSKRMQEN